MNLISSQVPGAELNRGKSESSDQTGLVRFSFSFLLLFAFCSFSRRSFDTLHDTGRPFGKEPNAREALKIVLTQRCVHIVWRCVTPRRSLVQIRPPQPEFNSFQQFPQTLKPSEFVCRGRFERVEPGFRFWKILDSFGFVLH